MNRFGAGLMAQDIIEACDDLTRKTEILLQSGGHDATQTFYHSGFLHGVKAVQSFAQFKIHSQSPYDVKMVEFYIEDLRDGFYDESGVTYFDLPTDREPELQ